MEEKLILEQPKRISYQEAFQELQQIATILSDMGLTVREYVYDKNPVTGLERDWKRGTSFGLVIDGLDGVRAMSSKKSGHFEIWFTNGFEDPENSQRKEITKRLKDAGFQVN